MIATIRQSRLFRSLRKDHLAITGLVVLFGLVAVALFAEQVAPVDPFRRELTLNLKPPVWTAGGTAPFWLGTDQAGRDILSNLLYGIRISFAVGFIATLISLVLGVTLGLISGYYGGWVDALIMRCVDILLAMPLYMVALVVMAVWGSGLWKLVLLIGLLDWAGYARAVRGMVLSVRENDYIQAVQALGAKDSRILFRHVLPNIIGPIIVYAAVNLPRVIMLESSLSFLGLGVPVTTPSLGLMISRGFQVLFSGAWWVTVFPGLVLMLTVFAINVIGDWLRDALDPQTR